jgi:hypothetical protein
VQRKGTPVAPKVGPGTVQRVVNFDAFYDSFQVAMRASSIPASKIFGYRVNVPLPTKPPLPPVKSPWAAAPSQTVNLAGVQRGVLAVAYSRLIQDALAIGKKPRIPPPGLALADITGRLLTLPPIPGFSSRSAPTDFRAFCKANIGAIANCLRDENAKVPPLNTFVNDNDLTGFVAQLGIRFGPGIWQHHLFVAEFAHEVTDVLDPKP